MVNDNEHITRSLRNVSTAMTSVQGFFFKNHWNMCNEVVVEQGLETFESVIF